MADELDEAAAVAAWRAGDKAAGAALFRRHFMSVYRYFVNKTPAVADDLTQRVFVACLERREQLRSTTLRAYLLGIAHHTLLMYLRTQMRHDGRFVLGEVSVADIVTSPSEAAGRGERASALLEALRRLPLDVQATLELFYWEDLGVAEVAAILGVPVGTIKARLSRARETLREQMERMGVDPALRSGTLEDLDRWARSLRDQFDHR